LIENCQDTEENVFSFISDFGHISLCAI